MDIHAKVLNDKELHSQRISAEDEYQTWDKQQSRIEKKSKYNTTCRGLDLQNTIHHSPRWWIAIGDLWVS